MTSEKLIDNLADYLYKKVKLTTERSEMIGYVKCIDPLAQNIAIAVKDQNKRFTTIIIVMNHAIKHISIVDHADDDDVDEKDFGIRQLLSSTNQNDCSLSKQEISLIKNNVMELLKKNYVPFEELENDSLIIAYSLTLMPPYRKEDCICSNEIVLGKIHQLLDSLETNS